MSDSLWAHELQHTRPPCPSPTPGVYSNPCPLSQWCHPTISSSVDPFSSCPQSFPASGSFPMSQLFASGGQNTGVSASISVLPMNTQDWSPLGWTGWISLQTSDIFRFNQFFIFYQFCKSCISKRINNSDQRSEYPLPETSNLRKSIILMEILVVLKKNLKIQNHIKSIYKYR